MRVTVLLFRIKQVCVIIFLIVVPCVLISIKFTHQQMHSSLNLKKF